MSPTRLRLHVKAGARRNALLGTRTGVLKISVTSAPEKGKANKAVLKLLAEALDVAPSTLKLVAGVSSPNKTVLVPLSPADVAERIERLAD